MMVQRPRAAAVMAITNVRPMGRPVGAAVSSGKQPIIRLSTQRAVEAQWASPGGTDSPRYPANDVSVMIPATGRFTGPKACASPDDSHKRQRNDQRGNNCCDRQCEIVLIEIELPAHDSTPMNVPPREQTIVILVPCGLLWWRR